jgi:NADH-quinone oxidoreductase subunit M
MVIALAVIGIIYGALVALGQADMKRLFAYSSMSHFGFIALGIFVFTSAGQSGSVVYMVAHGLSTAALFLTAGFLMARRSGSSLISDYGGVAKVAPVLGGFFLFAALSALALPGLAPFVGEFLVLLGTFEYNVPVAVVATVGIVLAAAYALRLYQKSMTGPPGPGIDGMADLRGREVTALVPVVALTLVLGFVPTLLTNVVNPAVERTIAIVTAADGSQP